MLIRNKSLKADKSSKFVYHLLLDLIFLFILLILLNFIIILFFFARKIIKFDSLLSSIFECGFTSYFYSRFSFSIHYFVLALIFLFLDLELCFIIPFFCEYTRKVSLIFLVFVLLILFLGLILEWKQGKLDWIF